MGRQRLQRSINQLHEQQRVTSLNSTRFCLIARVHFTPILAVAFNKPENRNKMGRPPFDRLMMFKILILQSLYNLSDDQMEYQITDRRSFMRFLGLKASDKVPDSKTIWKFRETLIQQELIEALFF
jgi:transposase